MFAYYKMGKIEMQLFMIIGDVVLFIKIREVGYLARYTTWLAIANDRTAILSSGKIFSYLN
jgi:hypothetical protein